MKWLKRLFCNHNWKCTDEGFNSWWAGNGTPNFQCSKCGKVEGI